MSTVETLQCPNCGAQLEPAGRESLYCTYCGAHLKVKTGASGNPMATLDGIKEDTSTLAREATYARLEKDVAALLERKQELRAMRKAEEGANRNRGGCAMLFGFMCILGALVAFGTGYSAWYNEGDIPFPATNVAIGVVCIAICVILFVAGHQESKQADMEHAEALAKIDAERAKVDEAFNRLSAQMREIRAQLDGEDSGKP